MNTKQKRRPTSAGFTLIEILMVMGIIALLAAIVIVAINPARQFAQARNSQRVSNVNAILNAVGQNVADNRGVFACAAGDIPTVATAMGARSGGYNIAPCLVPLYLPSLPFDPSAPGAHNTSEADYDTGYTIARDSVTNRITVAAPHANTVAELSQEISVTR